MKPLAELNHSELVAALAKPGADILASLTPEDCHHLHMATGAAGEAGELLDVIKAAVIYRKPLLYSHVIEELGDLEFFMEGLRSSLGITREQTLAANIQKLAKRYDQKYSDHAAQTRADKVEAPRCGFQPANRNYGPCSREAGHSGACAHDFVEDRRGVIENRCQNCSEFKSDCRCFPQTPAGDVLA